MTAVLLLMRHAVHDRVDKVLCGRMPGVRLSDAGRAQARAAAEALARRTPKLDALYSSPLERAQETAVEAAAVFGVAAVTVDPLLEEIDVGGWTGKRFEELHADPAWSRWNSDRGRTRAPGGESLAEAQVRAAAWIEAAARRHAGETVLAVSHSDWIKAALSHVLGLPLAFYDRFDIAPASVSAVAAGDWGMKVLSMNLTAEAA